MVFRYSGNVKSAPLSLRAGMTTASPARALCAGTVRGHCARAQAAVGPAAVDRGGGVAVWADAGYQAGRLARWATTLRLTVQSDEVVGEPVTHGAPHSPFGHRLRGRVRRRRARHRHPGQRPRSRAAPASRSLRHVTVCRPHTGRDGHGNQARGRPADEPRSTPIPSHRLYGGTRRRSRPRQPHIRRPVRPAAPDHPGRNSRGSPRRRRPPGKLPPPTSRSPSTSPPGCRTSSKPSIRSSTKRPGGRRRHRPQVRNRWGAVGNGTSPRPPAHRAAPAGNRGRTERRGLQQPYATAPVAYPTRVVLPVGDLPTPVAHQRLPGALDPPQVQTAAGEEEGLRMLGRDRQAVPSHVCALGLDSLRSRRLVIRMTRAR